LTALPPTHVRDQISQSEAKLPPLSWGGVRWNCPAKNYDPLRDVGTLSRRESAAQGATIVTTERENSVEEHSESINGHFMIGLKKYFQENLSPVLIFRPIPQLIH
jgi:hypothetical protein